MGITGSKNAEDQGDRVLVAGRPDLARCDNMITTAKYTVWSFLPIAIGEQFRRFANLYFLAVGIIMAVGTYTELYESAISPWTTLGPLAFVISVSLLVEGAADLKRHQSDSETNNAPCVILRRGEEINGEEGGKRDNTILGGKDVVVNLAKAYFQTSNNREPETPLSTRTSDLVNIGFQQIRRMDIRQGHIVLVKNREMVPADMILLASSGDNGGAYIETSSIDGETNLKLRTSPHLPKKLLKHLRDGTPMDSIDEEPEDDEPSQIESIEQATKRVTRFSALAYPEGTSALLNPNYDGENTGKEGESKRSFFSAGLDKMKESIRSPSHGTINTQGQNASSPLGATKYIAALTSEAPNPHVNTFSGKLTVPPVEENGTCYDIPLGADNILLRGAVIRNTEWVIGLACFTGTDTKLVQNSFETPSKFSQLDVLMNKTVLIIIIIMIIVIGYLSTQAIISNNQQFDYLWYIGLNSEKNIPWPYLPDNLTPPDWDLATPNWLQMFFLYVTLLSNFVPLSMYVTVEAINFFFLFLIYVDSDMYDAKTDTRGLARSTNVTDLGQVQYVFSDKTGTLTQNVMRFKRCSVDGMVFGAPIQKSRPGADSGQDTPTAFHPLRQLLVGRVNAESAPDGKAELQAFDGKLTFNSEMFLRVMCLCHTVVVEKDLDMSDYIDASKSVSSQGSNWSAKNYAKKFFGGAKRGRSMSDFSTSSAPNQLEAVTEEGEIDSLFEGNRSRAVSTGSMSRAIEKSADGAPAGFAYQAESPDEGALVSAASKSFGFQVIGRDSSGIKLSCAHPTIFSNEEVVKGIKSGQSSCKRLAAETAEGLMLNSTNDVDIDEALNDPNSQRIETWSILAVNKFDSDRKRMSILLRSPPELGNIPMLLCKGADSSMLDPAVCSGSENLVLGRADDEFKSSQGLGVVAEDVEAKDQTEWDMAQMLGIQSHLGDFASEGLRTLVLGVRLLSENECERWLTKFKAAATSIKNRDELLKDAAIDIEQQLHIVGATAIEDKLQVGVPKTIATLEKAGIKLWVLTGDKRETAIEIGYATHVLTPKMHLTEVSDKGLDYVRAQCAMEFIKLVKAGKLPQYQRAEIDQRDDGWTKENMAFAFGKFSRRFSRNLRSASIAVRKVFGKCVGGDIAGLEEMAKGIEDEEQSEKDILKDLVRRRNVRNRAEKIIKTYLRSMQKSEGLREGDLHKPSPTSPASEASGELSLSSDDVPTVFNRAQSARSLLQKKRSEGKLGASDARNLSLAQLTAQEAMAHPDHPVDEDTLSLHSFFPTSGDATSDFDRKRRTVLERLFAVDRDVRKGRLVKHLKKEKRMEALASPTTHHAIAPAGDGPRALVIEGAALKHLLGDSELEEVIFSIASKCEAVIACRVSPRQKALLVKLVRHHVEPEPVTLAIGDGANDVGMIQEAHVGVGISGKEGKQAVNASDFAIAQFRFLETLVLIHGRWNFFRLSTVVMFSFYKNAVMAGCLVVFNGETLFSGTPLFDEWIIAMLNFVAGLPILILGLFDRCLDKEYILANPEVYQPTRQNELITLRVLIRWVILTFGHIFVLYYGTIPQLSLGGGMTSAFSGLMRNNDESWPGDGEGGDLQSVGTVTFTALIILLAYKVLFESRSLIHGRWPAFTCSKKEDNEGVLSRLGYTWLGFGYGSILFHIFFLYMYHIIGERRGPGEYFNLVGVTPRVFGTRSLSWISILFIPILGMAFDLSGKVFSNMFFPTQTQIHIEIEQKAREGKRRQERGDRGNCFGDGGDGDGNDNSTDDQRPMMGTELTHV